MRGTRGVHICVNKTGVKCPCCSQYQEMQQLSKHYPLLFHPHHLLLATSHVLTAGSCRNRYIRAVTAILAHMHTHAYKLHGVKVHINTYECENLGSPTTRENAAYTIASSTSFTCPIWDRKYPDPS